MEDDRIEKVFHNANFDVIMFFYMGITVKGKIWDTLTMLHVYKNNLHSYALKKVCEKLFGISIDDQSDLKKDVMKCRRQGKKLGYALGAELEEDYWLASEILCEKYAVGDTIRTQALFLALYEEYNTDEIYSELVDMELQLVTVLRKMMLRGHKINLSTLSDLKVYYHKIIETQTEIKKKLGYENLNVGSPKQLMKVFYEELGFPIRYITRKNKKTGERKKTPTINNDTLFGFSNRSELAECLVILATAEHQIENFVIPFQEIAYEGILRPNYRSSGTITNRLSCGKPNLMNITSKDSPKKRTDEVEYRIRSVFIPRDGHYLLFPDYKQIELWIAAFLSQDSVLMDALISGKDIHAITALACFGMLPDFEKNYSKYRKLGKIINFAVLYGAGAGAIMDQTGLSFGESTLILQKFWGLYKGLAVYNKKLYFEAQEKGFITSLWGRIFRFESGSAYKAMNTMVQSTCAEIIKHAMINVNYLLEKKWPLAHLQLSIHDELGIEVPNHYGKKEILKDIISAMQSDFHKRIGMPNPFPVSPALAEKTWYDKIELDPITFETILST
jgi:DNA polymerase-1